MLIEPRSSYSTSKRGWPYGHPRGEEKVFSIPPCWCIRMPEGDIDDPRRKDRATQRFRESPGSEVIAYNVDLNLLCLTELPRAGRDRTYASLKTFVIATAAGHADMAGGAICLGIRRKSCFWVAARNAAASSTRNLHRPGAPRAAMPAKTGRVAWRSGRPRAGSPHTCTSASRSAWPSAFRSFNMAPRCCGTWSSLCSS